MKALCIERSLPRALAVQALRRVRPSVALGSLSPVRYLDVPEPTLPGSRWVKVKNRECGLCGTDVHVLQVDIDPLTFAAGMPLPGRQFLGHEAVGHVVEVGDEAARPAGEAAPAAPYGREPFAVGDRVALRIAYPSCFQMELQPLCPQCARGAYILCERVGEKPLPAGAGGGFSPFMVCHRSQLFHVPAAVPDVRAVLLEPTAVAVHAVLRRPAVPGERVLVVGAGSIGLLTVAALAALCPGAEVHCVARHAFQAERAASMGARPHLGGKGLYPRLAAATGARYLRGLFGTSFLLGGFDQVIDTVGTAASLAGSLRWVKAGGRVLAVGASFRRLRIDLTPLWYQEVELLGVDSHAVEADGRTTFDIAAELLADSAFPVDGLVTHRFRMDDWPQAVRAFTDKRSSGAVKIVLEHRAAL